MHKLLDAGFSTGRRTLVSIAVLMLGLFFVFRMNNGMFYFLIALAFGAVAVLLVAWRVGGSEQHEHDASMNRLPSIDQRVRDWIANTDDYDFPPYPDMPEHFRNEALRNASIEDSQGEASQ